MTTIKLKGIDNSTDAYTRKKVIKDNLTKLDELLKDNRIKIQSYTTLKKLNQLQVYYQKLLNKVELEIKDITQLTISF